MTTSPPQEVDSKLHALALLLNPKKNAKIESEDEEEKMGVLGDLAPSLVYFVDPIKEAKGEASITESQADS